MKRNFSPLRLCVYAFILLILVSCGGTAEPTRQPAEQPVEATEALATSTAERPAATPTESEAAPEVEDETAGTPAYLDPTLPVEARVEDLLGRMTLAEKVGQMTLVEKDSIRPNDIETLAIGALLSGGGGSPSPNTPEAWAEMVNGFQERALATRLAIPLLYGVDAVHGHNNVRGATIFPHNIGLGAAGDPILMEQIGRATAEEVAATGIRWNYAPVVAVPQDIRWGRTYEGYSENSELVSTLAVAYLRGLQSPDGEMDLGNPLAVLATPKHYVGDGGTAWDSPTTNGYQLDQGVTEVNEATLRAIHLPPYAAVIEAGAANIMVSFSSWDGRKMHAQDYLLTDVLKGELGFSGFLVSDWQAIDQIPGDYYNDVVTSINAGLDLIMVPYDYQSFMTNLTAAAENGDIPMERIDDAVRRILTVKFELGLFEQPYPEEAWLAQVGSADHRALAQQAVRQSLVLLKNEADTLPISPDTPVIFVAGEAADDIGLQSGGWTIDWQGRPGNITPGTTILQGIENTVSAGTAVHFNRFANFDEVTDSSGSPVAADIGIAVLSEEPYAEGVGDRADLSLAERDLAVLARLRQQSNRLVVILISGRPLIVTDQLPEWDAFVAAWLPGSEGQGVADVLFGSFPFTGRLSYTWPRTMAQIPLDLASLAAGGCEGPLFPFGYGLVEGETAVSLEECQ